MITSSCSLAEKPCWLMAKGSTLITGSSGPSAGQRRRRRKGHEYHGDMPRGDKMMTRIMKG